MTIEPIPKLHEAPQPPLSYPRRSRWLWPRLRSHSSPSPLRPARNWIREAP